MKFSGRFLFYVSTAVLFISTGLKSQEVNELRVYNITIDTSNPTDLVLNRGRIIWKDQDFGSDLYNLKYFSGHEIVRLDSGLVGLTADLDGDYVVWNTSSEEIKCYNVREWTTSTLGESYNPDASQTVSTANGLVAYARRKAGGGTEIVLHSIASDQDTTLTVDLWNTEPSVHHSQVAWVASVAEDPGVPSNILFFDGLSSRNVTNGTGKQNRGPILKDGQVAWLQIDDSSSAVRLFTGDSTITIAQPSNATTVIQGYDLSNGIAVAALTDTLGNTSEIIMYDSEAGDTTVFFEQDSVAHLHIDNKLVTWIKGTGLNGKPIRVYNIDTGIITSIVNAYEAVVDDEQFAWTLGEAVELGVPITYQQITSDGKNGWEQTRFKTIDNGNVVWGNYDNSLDMRLFYTDGSAITQLTDSSVSKDFVMANDGYVIWRHNFDFLWAYDGSGVPVQVVDSIQLENPYTAGGFVGFFGFRVDDPNTIKHAWLYDIDSDSLIQLTTDTTDNWTVLCDGNTACWRNQRSELLMFFDGTTTSVLSDSIVEFDYSYRNGKIVWSERRGGVWQIMLYDVSSGMRSQLTQGSKHMVNPVTDGSNVVWFENAEFPSAPSDPVMWYYDLESGQASKVTHYYPGIFQTPWLSNGKIGWAENGNVYVYDGQTISRLTNEFLTTTDVDVVNEYVIWRRTPNPNLNNNGDVFRGKLQPRVAFNAVNITGPAPLTVSFLNRSWQGDKTHQWDFGDGETSTAKNPAHTYQDVGTYTVKLTVTGPTGSVSERKIHLVRVLGTTSASGQTSVVPRNFALYQNYPNPFNPSTTIKFDIAELGNVTLTVYNILGQEVATLVDEKLTPGLYSIRWDASKLASGIYIYNLQSEGFVATKKLLLVK